MVCERGPVWHSGWNGATAGGLNGLEAGMPEHSCHQGPVLSPGDEIRNSWGPKEGSGSRRFPRRSGRAWPTGRARSQPGSRSLRPAGLVPSPAVGGGPGGSRSSPGPAAAPERRGRGASAGAAPHGGWAGPHRSRSCRGCLASSLAAARGPSGHTGSAFTSSMCVNI